MEIWLDLRKQCFSFGLLFIYIFFLQLQYLRQVRGKHEARSTVVSGVGLNASSSDVFEISQIASLNEQQQILGPFGKYLDLLHSS